MHSKIVSAATVYALVGAVTAVAVPGQFVKRVPKGPVAGDWQQQVLALHNQERTGCGQQALIWNDLLAASSSDNAKQCVFKHSGDGQRSGAGENIAQGTIGAFGADALCQGWIDEKHGGGEDGHYTQIVWKDTTDLGCDLQECGGDNYLVCQYWPAGNFNGDDSNQVCVGGQPSRSSPGEHFGGFQGTGEAPAGAGGEGSSPVSGGDSPVDTGKFPVGTGKSPVPAGKPSGRKPSGGNRGNRGGKKRPTPTGSKKPCPTSGTKSSPVTGNKNPSYGQPRRDDKDRDSRPRHGRRPHHDDDENDRDSRPRHGRRPHHDSEDENDSRPVYGTKRVSDVDRDDNDDRRHRGHGGRRGDDRDDDDRRPSRGSRDRDSESDSGRRGGKKPCPDEGKGHRD